MATPLADIGIRAVFTGTAQLRQGMMSIRNEAYRTSGSINGLTGSFNRSQNALLKLGGGVAAVGGQIRQFGNLMSNFGLRMSALVTAPILFSGAAATKAGSDFESEMVKIINLADVAEDQVRNWGDTVLETASDLGKLPQELASGLYFVASSGIRDSAEAMNVMETAAKGSAIGLGETNTVAKTLTSAMITFGIEAERAADILVATVREGQGEASDLAGTLGRVLGIAGSVGATFEDVGAFIATFTRLGVPAEVAVTSLRTALTNLINPTAEAKEVLEEYGLTAEEVIESIGTKGLARTLVQLLDGLKTTEDITAIFGSARALAGILGTAVEQSEDYVNINDIIVRSNDALASSFDRLKDTPEFAFNSLKASMQALAIQISRALLPSLSEIARRITEVVTRLVDFAKENPRVIRLAAIFGTLAAAIGPVLFLFGALISTFGVFVVGVGVVIASLGSVVTLVSVPLVAAFGAATAAITGLGIALAITAQDIQRKMGPAFETLITKARSWGSALITNFARGMLSAFRYIVRVLTALGNLVARWLAPGSPPRITPDLDKWGAEAMEVYLRGWTEADFSVLNEIGGTISGFIRSFGAATGTDNATIAEAILGSQSALVEAISSFRETGTVAEEVINRITASVGSGGDKIRQYVLSMLDLAAATDEVESAQNALNAVNEKFDKMLLPLNDRLDELNDMRAEWQRQLEEDKLRAILSDPRASDEAKRRAMLELERLDILRNIDQVENMREDQVSPLETELALAKAKQEVLQAQVSSQRELIRLQTQLNNLIAGALSLSGVSVGGVGDVGDIDTGGVGGVGDEDEEPFRPDVSEEADLLAKKLGLTEEELFPEDLTIELDEFDKLLEELQAELDSVGSGIGQVSEEAGILAGKLGLTTEEMGGGGVLSGLFDEFFGDLQGDLILTKSALDEFSTAWANLFTIIAEKTDLDIMGRLSDTMGELARNIITGNKAAKDEALTDFLDGLGTFAKRVTPALQAFNRTVDRLNRDLGEDDRSLFQKIFPAISPGVTAIIVGGMTALGKAAELAGPPLEDLVLAITLFFEETSEVLDGTANWENIVASVVGAILASFSLLVNVAVGLMIGLWAGIQAGWEELKENLVGNSIIPDMIDDIVAEFVGLPGRILRALVNTVGVITAPFEDAVEALVGPTGILTTLGSKLVGAIQGALTFLGFSSLGFDLSSIKNIGTEIVKKIFEGITEWGLLGKFVTWLKGVIIAAAFQILDWNPFDRAPEGSRANTSVGGVTTGAPVLPGTSVPLVSAGRGAATTVNLGGQTINNGMDVAEFRAIVRQEVARAIRG